MQKIRSKMEEERERRKKSRADRWVKSTRGLGWDWAYRGGFVEIIMEGEPVFAEGQVNR